MRLPVTLALLAAILAACGDDDGHTAVDAGVDAVIADAAPDAGIPCIGGTDDEVLAAFDAAFCTPIAEASCARAEACACSTVDTWPAPAACRATLRDDCMGSVRNLLELDVADTIKACPAAAARCVATITATGGRCDPISNPAASNDCGPVLATSTPVGGACQGGWCADGTGRCDDTGHCAALPGEGAPCLASACQGGLVCNLDRCTRPAPATTACDDDVDCAGPLRCRDGHCAALGGDGDGCDDAFDCEAGLRCDGTCKPPEPVCDGPGADCGRDGACLAPSRRTCVTGPGLGEACRGDDECAATQYCTDAPTCAERPGSGQDCAEGVFCAAGLGCGEDAKCGPLPGDGASCALGPMGPLLCADGLGCLDGVCHPLPGDGQPCAMPNLCAPGLGCSFGRDGSVCVPLRDAGGECTAHECKPELYCDLGALVCKAPLATGEVCRDGNECGAAGSCVPVAPGDFRCTPMPGLDENCFFECQPGLVCHTVATTGTCAPPICNIVDL